MEQLLFGERLKNAREASGMSRETIASRLGVKTETIEHWEAGKVQPRANRLQTLASLLNVPLLWLLGGSQKVPDSSAGVSNRELLLQKITELGDRVDGLRNELENLRMLAENCD